MSYNDRYTIAAILLCIIFSIAFSLNPGLSRACATVSLMIAGVITIRFTFPKE